jgi:hypothetical protein
LAQGCSHSFKFSGGEIREGGSYELPNVYDYGLHMARRKRCFADSWRDDWVIPDL